DASHPNFLRPAADSPLVKHGAGNDDPSLPSYVGALPPEGVAPWNWDRTWRMPRPALLLTVSQDANDGGKYRTINEALNAAKPWATMRVLDGATYEETIALTDAKKQEGLTLEAVKAATLNMGKGVRRLVTIRDVPHVQIASFRFSDSA